MIIHADVGHNCKKTPLSFDNNIVMKRLLSFIFSIQVLLISSYPQQGVHLTESLGVSDNSISTKAMTKKIKDAAVKYQAYAPVHRLALFDYAFASDLNEYKKLNGFGILYIASLALRLDQNNFN
jgi:hypothetical protein